MRLNTALLLPALASAHGAHQHHQESFSQERLDELQQKWGTDVSRFTRRIFIN
jgi:agmatinase